MFFAKPKLIKISELTSNHLVIKWSLKNVFFGHRSGKMAEWYGASVCLLTAQMAEWYGASVS